MHHTLRPRKQGGDTIVEVMIVLAVLGLALGISYATANRSLLNTRQALENQQATQLLQSQVEALYYLAPTTNPDPAHNIFQNGPYCLYQTGNAANPYQVTTTGNYNANCQNKGPGGLYDLSVRHDSSDHDTFTLRAEWDDVLGQGTDSVTLRYRTHHD